MQRKKIGARLSASLRMGLALFSAAGLVACGGAESLEQEAPPSQQEQALVTLPIRINVGGGAYTDSYGRLWEADPQTWDDFRTTEPIAGTVNDELYQTMDLDSSLLSYSIPVPGPGLYTVQFLLIEPERNLSSPRSMDIYAEGSAQVLRYQDMVQPLRSYTAWFEVAVRDNSLNMMVLPGAGSAPAVVSAIEVTKSKWNWLGGSPLEAGKWADIRPSMAVDGSNRPVVAWWGTASDSPDGNILVSRWTGSTYQRLGGPLGDAGSTNPTVVVDATGEPLVAFIQPHPASNRSRVRVRRWSGTAWTEVGGLVGLDGYEAQAVAATLDRQGRPVLAVALFLPDAMDARIHVYRLNGQIWEQVGDAVAALGSDARNLWGTLNSLGIAVDPTDRIVVAWGESYWSGPLYGNATAQVFRRNNGVWGRVGAQALLSSDISPTKPSLALAADGTPWVAYRKNGVVDVVREQNGAWVSTSSAGLKGWSMPPITNMFVGSPLLQMDSTGTPTVLTIERADGNCGRFIRKWNGTAWSSLENRYGALDSTEFGGEVIGPYETDMALALNKSGQPVVAIPEGPVAGASHGRLRLRTFTP